MTQNKLSPERLPINGVLFEFLEDLFTCWTNINPTDSIHNKLKMIFFFWKKKFEKLNWQFEKVKININKLNKTPLFKTCVYLQNWLIIALGFGACYTAIKNQTNWISRNNILLKRKCVSMENKKHWEEHLKIWHEVEMKNVFSFFVFSKKQYLIKLNLIQLKMR